MGFGEYSNSILLKSSILNMPNDTLFLFFGKKSGTFTENLADKGDLFNFIDIEPYIDGHFWFDIKSCIKNKGSIILDLKNNLFHKVNNGLIFSSTWDGIGSGFFLYMISILKEFRIDSISIVVIPSESQSSDAYFNSYSSISMCINKGYFPIFIINRDLLENYIGVDRKGNLLKGHMILNEVLQLMLSKRDFIEDFLRFSKYFDSRMYTILIATGCSMKIYDSLENIFNSMLYRSLLDFNFKESSIFYVLVRIPVKLKRDITKEKVEFSFLKWIKDKSLVKATYICDPIFVYELNDRVDVMVIVGGFNEEKILDMLEEKSKETLQYLLSRGIIDEEKIKEIERS